MIEKLNIKIKFSQPVRVVPWKNKSQRKLDKKYLRGGTYAKWHMDDEATDTGRPYITGSVLRSVVFAEAEKILSIHNPYDCCSKQDRTENGVSRPSFMRKRAVYNFNEGKECSEENPCPLCLLKGRYDKQRRTEKGVNDFTTHFSNFKSEINNLIFKEAAVSRVVNRVDPESGKAKDFFTIYEIEPSISGSYEGTLTVNYGDSEKRKQIKNLIAVSLAQIKVLSGSICRIDIISEDHDILIKEYMNFLDVEDGTDFNYKSIFETDISENTGESFCSFIKDTAEEISKIFLGSDKDNKLRFAADAIRELRRKQASFLNELPTGINGEAHFLWDQKSAKNNITLRQILKKRAEHILNEKWRFFCEALGQALYDISKKQKDSSTSLPRLLGETEYFGVSSEFKDSYIPSESEPKARIRITGFLRAATPFLFGTENTAAQTSDAILLNRDKSFRLPASVIRGALRRDLRELIGDGCNKPVGGKPCECPVCKIMKRVVVEDGKSSCRKPPEIRYRTRLNPHAGTVEEGALFDIEAGFQGMNFTFSLYFEANGSNIAIPDKLLDVLGLWKAGNAFLGGNSSSGMGRFTLQEPKEQIWDLSDETEYSHYLLSRGCAGVDIEDFKIIEPVESFPWQKIGIKIFINSPLLSRDAINAMLDKRNPDTIMFKKAVYNNETSEFEYRYALKGESFRGVMRNTVAKGELGQEEKVYDIDHDSCDCIQCQLFGSVHQQGRLRFEDLEIRGLKTDYGHDVKMDHVAIDRFTGGGVDRMKFDDYPLPGSNSNQLTLQGAVWVKNDIDDNGKKAIKSAFADLRDGFLTLGGLGAIGYGNVSGIELVEKPDWLELPEENYRVYKFSERSVKATQPEVKLKDNVIYYPHSFLKPSNNEVKRETNLVSHVKTKDEKNNFLLSGKIKCRLKTCGPVFIPGTENDNYFDMQKDNSGHKNYGFFRIHNEIAIPGSSIRGMVSSVYEALTNSCFRVFDQRRYLTRSGQADANNEPFPGKVIKSNGSLGILEMEKSVRLPLYDVKENIGGVDEKNYKSTHPDKIKAAMSCNKEIAEAAEKNRLFLEKNYNDEEREEILKGRKPVYFTNKSFNKDNIACLTLDKNETEGYIKFTGPSMVNILSRTEESEPLDFLNKENLKLWDIIKNSLHNEIEERASQKKKYPRPVFKVKSETHEYSVLKRCEHVFVEKNSNENIYTVPEKIRRQYNDLRKDNKENTKTVPKIFHAWTLNQELGEGDLVYFRHDGQNSVTKIIPVRISRNIDDKPMGKRFQENNDSLLSCHHECLEECSECPLLCNKVSDYFSPHPRGLCPACHLFGTAHYKSRVGFGMAWLKKNKPLWYREDYEHSGNSLPLTMPLLERPRPTWSMPDKDSNIPGRKFYIHHPWSVDGLKASPTENNRTIEPLGEGNEFEFEIKFNNLRKWELGLLIYSLELEDCLGHKLGMGKALGFGSVQVLVESLLLKNTGINQFEDVSDDFKTKLIEEGFSYIKEDFTHNNLRKMLWLPKVESKKVRYPVLQKEDDKEKAPGYVELQKKWPENERQGRLCEPWNIWYDFSENEIVHNGEYRGVVKWFNEERGFGFIEKESGEDIFVHFSSIITSGFKTLNEGNKVQFKIGEDPKGPKAIEVKIIS